MGHNQLKKCTKYHLVSLLNEKQESTFANFLHFFYPVTLLTNSAMRLKRAIYSDKNVNEKTFDLVLEPRSENHGLDIAK